MKQIVKKLFFALAYCCTAFGACLLAFVLVLNFLNAVISEEPDKSKSQVERLTFKKVFGDIIKNLKTVAKENLLGDSEPSPGEEKPTDPPEAPQQVDIPKEDLKSFEESAEPVPGESTKEQALDEGSVPESPPETQPEPPAKEQALDEGSVPESPPETQPEPPAKEQLTDEDNPSELILEIQSYMVPFIYESIKQKDPFEDPTVKKRKGVVVIPKTPPEKYDLKEIQLKGIIWDTENPKALFKLPEDAGFYTLIKGDKIGKKGIIFDIREDEVVIVETNQLSSGDQIKEEQTVKIKRIDRIGLSSK